MPLGYSTARVDVIRLLPCCLKTFSSHFAELINKVIMDPGVCLTTKISNYVFLGFVLAFVAVLVGSWASDIIHRRIYITRF